VVGQRIFAVIERYDVVPHAEEYALLRGAIA
jgi:hypothetical protein